MQAPLYVTLPDDCAPRLDKALAEALADDRAEGRDLSRSRLAALIEAGALTGPDGATVRDARLKVKPGQSFVLHLPEPVAGLPGPEAIGLDIVHEDADLLVVMKSAGMVVHPAPGAETGTLVNALLHHCGPGLPGAADRPGIVHRIDKDTSGLLVVAKSAAAFEGLSALFARHDILRRYLALTWGAPDPADPRLAGVPGVTRPAGGFRIATGIGRHRTDRKRMAVSADGRAAVTRVRVLERFGAGPVASLAECRLETGRTHQIRVHLTHAGHPLVGDPAYGRARAVAAGALPPDAVAALCGFPRQALHAAALGFRHPVTGAEMAFEAPLPADFDHLLVMLRRNAQSPA